MADNSNRIGTSGISGASVELLRQAMGVGSAAPGSGNGIGSSSGGNRGAIGGARGSRILPPDYPMDQLDRKAARGTYIDILV